ncbi:hypothetical protein OAL64_01155 [bacterium]|nr:hypothetical protein [bacterium]
MMPDADSILELIELKATELKQSLPANSGLSVLPDPARQFIGH